MERGNVQPNDLLRCLLSELRSTGLVVKAIESRLAVIQNNPDLMVSGSGLLLPIAQVYHMPAGTKSATPVMVKDEVAVVSDGDNKEGPRGSPSVAASGATSPSKGVGDREGMMDASSVHLHSTGAMECDGSGLTAAVKDANAPGTSPAPYVSSCLSEGVGGASPAVTSIAGRHRGKAHKNYARIAEAMEELSRKPHGRLSSSVRVGS